MFENLRTATFGGDVWVNASVEWHNLPDCVKSSSEKWRKRLGVLKLPYALCRFTDLDNIESELENPAKGGKRTTWVKLEDWRTYVQIAYDRKVRLGHATAIPSVNHASGQHSGQVGQSGQVALEGEAPTSNSAGRNGGQDQIIDLDQIVLTHEEMFVYNGRGLNLTMYGERTPEGLFVNVMDAINIIGLRNDSIPPFVTVQNARANNETIRVVSFEMLITLICATANGYEVASALRKWITAVVVTSQFSSEAPVKQAVFATRGNKGYASKFYGFPDSREKYACLYMIEACAGQAALDQYPEQIAAILPSDRSIDEFCVVKRGSSIDGRTRTLDNRTTLKKIFPGSDPLPIHTSAFPQISEHDIVVMENSVFADEFDHRRIEGIRHRDGEYTELYLFDHLDIHNARLAMDSHACHYVKDTIVAAKDAATLAKSEADTKDRECDILKERLSGRDRELERSGHELERSERDLEIVRQRCTALENEVHVAREAARAELSHTRKAAISTMPADTAKIAAVFWGVGDA